MGGEAGWSAAMFTIGASCSRLANTARYTLFWSIHVTFIGVRIPLSVAAGWPEPGGERVAKPRAGETPGPGDVAFRADHHALGGAHYAITGRSHAPTDFAST